MYNVDKCHRELLKQIPQYDYLKYGKAENYLENAKSKFLELLGDFPEKCDLNIKIENVLDKGNYIQKRIIFDSEKYVTIPCYLLLPKGKEKPPVIICLQGHSKGMYLSIGEVKTDEDLEKIKGGDRDFALQAVENGYAALVIEQRCFGERESENSPNYMNRCHFTSMNALLCGRTMIGERVFDVSRAIDMLEELNETDKDKIACTGNSGGGTITYYASCVDNRIKISMPSCSVCTYESSIGSVYHCVCNYIPGMAKYFDMGDFASFIAPRKLIVVAGNEDNIFPIWGVKKSYDTIKKIYEDKGCKENCKLFIGEGGHRYYKDVWKLFNEYAKFLEW